MAIYISSRIFVPKKQIDTDVLKENFEFQNYNESACQRCPIYKQGERHSTQCDECPEYKGIMQLWRKKVLDGKTYIGLPPGQPARIERLFNLNLSKAIDLRPEVPFSQPIKFIQNLYDGSVIDGRKTVNQKQVVRDWLKVKNGIIECPPRGGKTVQSIYLACKLGYKTVIIANKRAILEQFYDSIMGNKKRGRAACTNARQLEKESGKTLVKIINKPSDFNTRLDIILCPYQKFIRNKKAFNRILKFINNNRATLILDEGHGAGANAYLRFIGSLSCKYRIVLSATPLRKDGADRMLRTFVGGVVAKSNVTAKIATIELVETGLKVKYPYRLWVYAMKHLSKSKKRNQLIVRDVFKDLRAGYHSIIIPIDFVHHGNTLVKMINRQAEINNIKRKEKWPLPMAVFFTASAKKSPEKMQAMLGSIDSGKRKVLVAIRSMIKEGVDLSRPEVIYNVVPTSGNNAAGAPLAWQLLSRVTTWHKDKKQPVARLYLDGMGQSFGCLKSLWWKEIFPGLKNTKEKPAKYKISKVEFNRIMQIVKKKEYTPPNKDGERITSVQAMARSARDKPSGFSSF